MIIPMSTLNANVKIIISIFILCKCTLLKELITIVAEAINNIPNKIEGTTSKLLSLKKGQIMIVDTSI